MDDFQSYLFFLLRKTPLILVLLGGLLFAIVRWKRHPRVSLLASIGLGFYIVEIFVVSAAYYFLPAFLERAGFSQSSSLFTVIQVVDDIIYSGILILLVAAALSQRPPKPILKCEILNMSSAETKPAHSETIRKHKAFLFPCCCHLLRGAARGAVWDKNPLVPEKSWHPLVALHKKGSTSEPGAVATGPMLSCGYMRLAKLVVFQVDSLAGRYRSRF